MPEQPTCGGCRYWRITQRFRHEWTDDNGTIHPPEDHHDDEGQCRRYAPCFHRSGWPATKRNDWCGEHAPKPDAGGKAER